MCSVAYVACYASSGRAGHTLAAAPLRAL